MYITSFSIDDAGVFVKKMSTCGTNYVNDLVDGKFKPFKYWNERGLDIG